MKNGNLDLTLRKRLFCVAKPTLLQRKTAAFDLQLINENEESVNWLIMSRKRNDLRKTALFVKGSNMQIQAKVQLLNRYPILP